MNNAIIDFINTVYTLKDQIELIEEEDLISIINNFLQVLFAKENNTTDYLVDSDSQKKALEILCKISEVDKHLSIEEKWTIMWELNYICFTNIDYKQYYPFVRNYYRKIYKQIEENVDLPSFSSEIKTEKDSPVVIITNQFLSIGHSPTRQVLDYAYSLQHDLNIPVIIINSGFMKTYSTNRITTFHRFNHMDELKEVRQLEYNGEEISFFNFPQTEKINYEIISLFMQLIKSFKPRCVLSIDDYNLLGDLSRFFAKTASLSLSISVPVSFADVLLYPGKVSEINNNYIEELLPYQSIFETIFNFKISDITSAKYTRSEYDLAEDAFLIEIIGNRLDSEIDNNFIDLMNKVCNYSEKCIFVIVGEVKNPQRITNKIDKSKNVKFIGKVEYSSEFCKIADIITQPKRIGGGRSTVEALKVGKPVALLNYGDSAHNAGDKFGVNTYDELFDEIIRLYEDKDYYSTKSINAFDRYLELNDFKTTLLDWMNYIDKQRTLK